MGERRGVAEGGKGEHELCVRADLESVGHDDIPISRHLRTEAIDESATTIPSSLHLRTEGHRRVPRANAREQTRAFLDSRCARPQPVTRLPALASRPTLSPPRSRPGRPPGRARVGATSCRPLRSRGAARRGAVARERPGASLCFSHCRGNFFQRRRGHFFRRPAPSLRRRPGRWGEGAARTPGAPARGPRDRERERRRHRAHLVPLVAVRNDELGNAVVAAHVPGEGRKQREGMRAEQGVRSEEGGLREQRRGMSAERGGVKREK